MSSRLLRRSHRHLTAYAEELITGSRSTHASQHCTRLLSTVALLPSTGPNPDSNLPMWQLGCWAAAALLGGTTMALAEEAQTTPSSQEVQVNLYSNQICSYCLNPIF